MTQDERIAYALRIIEQAGMVLEWRYDNYTEWLSVRIALPEKPSPVEAFKQLADALPEGFEFPPTTV